MEALKLGERRCDSCENGVVRRFARPGRLERRKGCSFELPASLELEECDWCGEMYYDDADSEAIDSILTKEMYTARVRSVVERVLPALTKDGLSLAEVERRLGLSEGYLSKIKKDSEPSLQLVALLAVLADRPAEGFEVISQLGQVA